MTDHLTTKPLTLIFDHDIEVLKSRVRIQKLMGQNAEGVWVVGAANQTEVTEAGKLTEGAAVRHNIPREDGVQNPVEITNAIYNRQQLTHLLDRTNPDAIQVYGGGPNNQFGDASALEQIVSSLMHSTHDKDVKVIPADNADRKTTDKVLESILAAQQRGGIV